jgi:hypothetical protein
VLNDDSRDEVRAGWTVSLTSSTKLTLARRSGPFGRLARGGLFDLPGGGGRPVGVPHRTLDGAYWWFSISSSWTGGCGHSSMR